jgi:hypothetical protein
MWGSSTKSRTQVFPAPKWMVLQLDTAEDPRPKVLYAENYGEDGRWKDLRGAGGPAEPTLTRDHACAFC